jgi:hypothetical protein
MPYDSLPLLINRIDDNIDKIAINKIQYIMEVPTISTNLASALLRKKRITLIVDGVSEMNYSQRNFISPESGAKETHCVIYTSRTPLDLFGSTTTIEPLGLRGYYLDALLDGFTSKYVGANKFGEQREILRNKVYKMVFELNHGDSEVLVPLSILRLMVEKASKLINEGKSLETLPDNSADLFDDYILDLYRHNENQGTSIKLLRHAALISLGLEKLISETTFTGLPISSNTLVPHWRSEDIYLSMISPSFMNDSLNNGILISSGSTGDKQVKFTHDPIAEYLSSKEIIIRYRDGKISQEQMQAITDELKNLNQHLVILLNSVAGRMNIILPNTSTKDNL